LYMLATREGIEHKIENYNKRAFLYCVGGKVERISNKAWTTHPQPKVPLTL
jgi:hypothetical protein